MDLPRFPVTSEDRVKYDNKDVEFRQLRHGNFLYDGIKGKLRISTNGTEGRVEIQNDEWADEAHTTIRTRVFNLTEEQFRSITPVGNDFLLDWSGRV